MIQTQRVPRLVQEHAVQVVSGADVETERGVDLDVARRRRAVRGWEIRVGQRRGVVGERVSTEANVAESGITLGVSQGVEVVRSVLNRHEVDVGDRFPGRQRKGNLSLPGAGSAEFGVERRVQDIRAVVPKNSIGGDAVGDSSRVLPAISGEDVVIARDPRHERALFETIAAWPVSSSSRTVWCRLPELEGPGFPIPAAGQRKALTERLGHEPNHDALSPSLGRVKVSGHARRQSEAPPVGGLPSCASNICEQPSLTAPRQEPAAPSSSIADYDDKTPSLTPGA